MESDIEKIKRFAGMGSGESISEQDFEDFKRLQNKVEVYRDRDVVEYNIQLEARVKTKEELVTSIDCVVESVDGYSSTASVPCGGHFNTLTSGGHSNSLKIGVSSDTPVENLGFYGGWPPIEKGDQIRAYVYVGEKEWGKLTWSDIDKGKSNPPCYLVERPLNPKEKPLKIEKLKDEEVVATYHSTLFEK